MIDEQTMAPADDEKVEETAPATDSDTTENAPEAPETPEAA